jgi:hypothetical protein
VGQAALDHHVAAISLDGPLAEAAEQEKKKAECVVHPLYKNPHSAPAVGFEPESPTFDKQLPF